MNLSQQIARIRASRRGLLGGHDEVSRAILSVPCHYAPLTSNVMSTIPPQYGDGEQATLINNRGDLRMAQSLPPYSELVRQGNSFFCALPTGSAFTFGATFPSTSGALVIWNGESDGGKSYLIDTIGLTAITSIAAASSLSVFAQIVPGRQAALTDTATILRGALSGKSAISSKAAINAASATMVANKWVMCGMTAASPAAAIGAGVSCDVYGRFVVPPGSLFGVFPLASTAAGTGIMTITWHEVLLNLA